MKTVDFSETNEACDLKVGRYRQLIDSQRYASIEGQGHFLTLAQRSCTYKNSNWIFSETTGPF